MIETNPSQKQAENNEYGVVSGGLSGKMVDDLFPSQAQLAAVMNIINRSDISVLDKAHLINIEYTTLR